MYKLPEYDMYEFIDDGVHKSIYSILHEYHPQLKRNFSLANLINNITELESTPGQERILKTAYNDYFGKLSKLLLDRTSTTGILESTGKKASEEELNKMFEEFKEASRENSDCKFFATVKEYIEYAIRNASKPESKALRDVIVTHAVQYASKDEVDTTRAFLLKNVYLSKAEDKVRAVNHKSRQPGEYPEWDRLVAIRHILQRKNGLREYDEFYDEATAQIRAEAFKAMEKARVSAVCKMKRAKEVRTALEPSIPVSRKRKSQETSDMFDKLKRLPEKNENSWAYESYREPELICDLDANYSENGMENQRVIAFRYGRFKYKNTQDVEGFNIDRTAEMPELVGISRIGKDGTKTYFVLMPPLDRLSFRPYGEKPQDPGDKPYSFLITQDVKVTTRSGGTRVRKETKPAKLVDGKTGRKLSAFRNREIPENLKEFYAKVFFSDEYLSNAIESNGRYIGAVIETENGPQIVPTDTGKANLSAAYYAKYHEGTVDRLRTRTFEDYCTSGELDIKQYNLINDHEKSKAKEKAPKTDKNDGAR